MSGDEQTHLGAAHTQILCFIIHTLRHVMSIKHSSVHNNRTQNLWLGIIHLFLKKMDQAKGKQFFKKKQYFCAVCNKDPLLI